MLWRLIVILFGLTLAAGAGLVFLTASFASTEFGDAGPEAFAQFALFAWLITFFSAEQGIDPLQLLGMVIAAAVVAPVAMPGALVAILTEAFGWRSLTLHMTANAALGAVVGALVGLYDLMAVEGVGAAPVETRAVLMMAATGGVVGFIYWLIAGRNASGFLVAPVSSRPSGR
ncbi:hypothetical protein BV133_1364 [Blastochloris viridis]|uniref:Uncharacterized protein n=1 Tax=Blastochloris viridis TaxID=1079 RepID=A0A182D1V0_BLAVI|nr:hypothetical protein BV133_1364 [Blastochloris viridis]